jgi:hypothetical protein
MNDNDKFNAVFDPRDGDPHHIAAYDHDEAMAWPWIVAGGAVLFAVCVAAWWWS